MIHGHKKSKKVKSEQQTKQQQQLSLKINSKLAQFFSLQRNDIPPHQIPKLLEFISLLMQLCTDIPTIFNFRRQLIILSNKDKSPIEIAQTLKTQIKLTTKLIQGDTKSYTIWSYRQWVVKQLFLISNEVIKAEKDLIKLLLTKDQKNFHVWNYRNWLNSLQSDLEEDLNFTQEKIKTNPFNFSPYHFRTKFLTQKYKKLLQQQISQQERKQITIYGMPKKVLDDQFQRIKTAIFINPNEEAPWLYYNWLLNQMTPNFDSQSSSWVRLSTTLKLSLGELTNKQWIKETYLSILQRELQFLGEVIESQQTPCRFAYLQKASVYKLILQLGTSQTEFVDITKKGYETINAIKDEPKAQKYTLKQLQYWKRLHEGQLTVLQQSLRCLWNC